MSNQHKLARYSDQFHCSRCGKQWDADDKHPPKCLNRREYGLYQIELLRMKFKLGKENE